VTGGSANISRSLWIALEQAFIFHIDATKCIHGLFIYDKQI